MEDSVCDDYAQQQLFFITLLSIYSRQGAQTICDNVLVALLFLLIDYGYVILYHKNNLVYTDFFPQFLIFQKKIKVPRRKEN